MADESESEEEDWNGGLRMFPGLVTYWAGIKEEVQEDQKDEEDMMGLREGVHISDDEDDLVSARIGGDDFISEKEEHLPTQSLVVATKPEETPTRSSDLKNAKPDAHRLYLGGLLGVYADDGMDNDSDSDDEDGPPVEVKIIKSSDSSILPAPVALPSVEIKSESVPTVQCSEPGKSRHRKRKPAAPKDAAEKSALPPPPKVERPDVLCQPMRPPTLLEKLLLDEINRERNVVLQCVRYVCDKNFFLN